MGRQRAISGNGLGKTQVQEAQEQRRRVAPGRFRWMLSPSAKHTMFGNFGSRAQTAEERPAGLRITPLDLNEEGEHRTTGNEGKAATKARVMRACHARWLHGRWNGRCTPLGAVSDASGLFQVLIVVWQVPPAGLVTVGQGHAAGPIRPQPAACLVDGKMYVVKKELLSVVEHFPRLPTNAMPGDEAKGTQNVQIRMCCLEKVLRAISMLLK